MNPLRFGIVGCGAIVTLHHADQVGGAIDLIGRCSLQEVA